MKIYTVTSTRKNRCFIKAGYQLGDQVDICYLIDNPDEVNTKASDTKQ